MANQGKRKWPALDVMMLSAKLKKEDWKFFLRRAMESGNIEKLLSYRYGLQAGLADAASKGLTNQKIDIWVIGLIRNVEQAMKYILKKKHPMPGDVVSKTHKGKRIDYAMTAIEAKRRRDKEFSEWLLKSNF